MSYLVKIPLLVAIWGSFAHATGAPLSIAQVGIDCGGKGWLSDQPSMSSAGYISIKLIPVAGVYDLVLERTNSGHTINIAQTIAHGLNCKISEAAEGGDSNLRVSCTGGTATSPQKFDVGEYQYGSGGYVVEAQSDAIVSAREQGFDGDQFWAAEAQPASDKVIKMLFSGGGFTCTPLDPVYTGRSMSAER